MSVIDRLMRKKFHADPEHSHTLPARLYYDPEIYEREKDAIFYKTWQFMGHAEQVANAGDYVTRKIHDQNIVILRGKDQTLRAFHNVCQHRAHELLEGSGNVKVITCPYHAWSYELDGALRSARGSEKVAGFNPDDICLKNIQVEVFVNFLFVNLDLDAPSLKSQTGNLEDEMRRFLPRLEGLTLAHRFSYDVKANWKNLIENFSECYHCPIVHQDLCANVLDLDSYRITTHDVHQSHHSRQDTERRAIVRHDLQGQDRRGRGSRDRRERAAGLSQPWLQPGTAYRRWRSKRIQRARGASHSKPRARCASSRRGHPPVGRGALFPGRKGGGYAVTRAGLERISPRLGPYRRNPP
jgi:phenylpropionate dioxygenase-like ring-hydroxylating dioxygenase large terminal subunit